MNSFVDIRRVFINSQERNLEYLSGIYDNPDLLLVYIKEILSERLSPESVRNKKVLLKPNWVTHSSNPADKLCLYTADSFLLAALESVLDMSPAKVTIGDAPIQGCDWSGIVTKELSDSISFMSKKYNVPVIIKDFRRTVFNPGENKPYVGRRPLDAYLIFDLALKSILEPITLPGRNKFRVTGYDQTRLKDSHRPGVHKYCITKELFESDIIISLPKIKMHQKTGITGALKNLVGFNGDKDFLPHHRIGGTTRGGDCYPGESRLRYYSELIMDLANKNHGRWQFHVWRKVAAAVWKMSFPGEMDSLEAGWFGNDTTWRMVIDLNKIVMFGLPDGTFSDNEQRKVYSLCDGIIAGQGEGPLNPSPLPFGIISFTDNPAANDSAMALLLGFDFHKFPLLTQAAKIYHSEDCDIYFNSNKTVIGDLEKYSLTAIPPRGWREYLKADENRNS